MVELIFFEYVGFICVFSELNIEFDILIVDIVVGILDMVLSFLCVV